MLVWEAGGSPSTTLVFREDDITGSDAVIPAETLANNTTYEWWVVAYHPLGHTFSDIASFTTSCPADINGDGLVNYADVLAFLDAFLILDPAADLNEDGFVNFADNLLFIAAFQVGC